MAKVEQTTDDATDRDVWQVSGNAFVRIVGILGMLCMALAVAALIAQVGR